MLVECCRDRGSNESGSRSRRDEHPRGPLASLVAGGTLVALVVGGIMLARTTTESPLLELPYGSVGDADSVVLSLATVLTFSVVGAIVASRHPRNIIDRIF